ncbi:MAG: hypothetical protein ACQESR_30415, partial [Planctomycetota bacterium]
MKRAPWGTVASAPGPSGLFWRRFLSLARGCPELFERLARRFQRLALPPLATRCRPGGSSCRVYPWWLDAVNKELGHGDRRQAYRVLRGVLLALRDRLT